MNNDKLRKLFDGWNDTLIQAYFDGTMGSAIADDEENPKSAQIINGDFCFFAGIPDDNIVRRAGADIMTPRDEAWSRCIERVWRSRAERHSRYSIRKDTVFDKDNLKYLSAKVPEGFRVKRFDRDMCEQSVRKDWSCDFLSLFSGIDDFLKRGIGFGAVTDSGKLVSGASSYAIADGRIEIEIDTDEEYRRIGLATACGASLIFAALEMGAYPSWDAHDLRSVALAEKFGYRMDREYYVYYLTDSEEEI